MADRPWGFRGWPIQWNHAKCCGPTLVAMATKFGLGAEIQSPTFYYEQMSEFSFQFRFLFRRGIYHRWRDGGRHAGVAALNADKMLH